jgi:hypothetical protein
MPIIGGKFNSNSLEGLDDVVEGGDGGFIVYVAVCYERM